MNIIEKVCVVAIGLKKPIIFYIHFMLGFNLHLQISNYFICYFFLKLEV